MRIGVSIRLSHYLVAVDKFKALSSFVSIAMRNSLSAAAREEGIAPAMMGRRLDALEASLGVKLMVRTTRRVSLTREGAAFLEDCQRLLADLADAESSVTAKGAHATGHLRITAPAGFGRRHIAPLVPIFRQRYPGVTVSLNVSDRILDLTSDGFDCAVRIGDLADSSLVSVRIADNRRLCVAAPAYVAKRGQPQHPTDLLQHDALVLSSDASQAKGWAFRALPLPVGGQAFSAQAERADIVHIKPTGPLDCSDGQVLHDWCLAGHGIAWRSTWEVEADIAAGRLVVLLDAYAAPPNGIYAVFAQRKHLPLRVRLWVDFLKQQYQQTPLMGSGIP